MLLAPSIDAVWIILALAALAWAKEWRDRRREKARDARVGKVEEARREWERRQEKKLDSVHNTGVKTELLCNSAMGRSLEFGAKMARMVADSLPNDPVHRAAAELAEHALAEHCLKQARVDVRDDAKENPT